MIGELLFAVSHGCDMKIYMEEELLLTGLCGPQIDGQGNWSLVESLDGVWRGEIVL